MKCKGLLAFAVMIGLVVFTSAGFGARDDSEPSAFFPQTRYDFSPVLDGAKVVHEFVIQNKGTATLTIDRVKTA